MAAKAAVIHGSILLIPRLYDSSERYHKNPSMAMEYYRGRMSAPEAGAEPL